MSNPRPRKPHGSIPGYRPGPILSRNHKVLLWGILIVPTIVYGIMKVRQLGQEEQDRLLELEGRAMWEQKYGKQSNLKVDVGRSGGGI